MTSFGFEIIIIAMITSLSCSLLGTFLILRKVSMLSDAISHSVLLGIVLGFFLVHDITHPLLIIGAAITGILTVVLTELLMQTNKVKEDASIGLIFPFLFSIAIILITKFASDVHIDVDAVLLGEIAFAPFNRLILFGLSLPKSMLISGILLLVNIGYIILFYKELKLTTFDKGLAVASGFSPLIINYSLMTLVSITTVGAFEAVGSILVVALMITIPASAYLLTEKLHHTLLLSVFFSMLTAVFGYFLALYYDASIAGSMAVVTGIIFLCCALFSPKEGLIHSLFKHSRQKRTFRAQMLLVHLHTHEHEDTKAALEERSIEHTTKHIGWEQEFAKHIVSYGIKKKWISKKDNNLYLTQEGRDTIKQIMTDTKLVIED